MCYFYFCSRAELVSGVLKKNNVRPGWLAHYVQDECLLEPELYERAEELFRGLLHYVTDFLVWEENLELPAELQPWYGPHNPSQMLYISVVQNTPLNTFSIHTAQKKMHTTVYCTTMSTTHTSTSSTPCSALLTVMRLKPRHTRHLLTKRYFCFQFLLMWL